MAHRSVAEQAEIAEDQPIVVQKGGTQEDVSKRLQVDFIGNSPVMREIYSMIHLVADSSTPVLITGESGTGKDVVARLIHMKSPRSDLPFIAINCAAVPKDVFENELFGHEHGAFTGAISKKSGYLEMADRGTLFLDELAEMETETQAKLLRVIETKAFRRLGGKSEMSADVRMLAATNKDVARALKAGELRRDLYYRFSVIEIYLPPLRERKEDVPLLVDHFLKHFCHKHKKTLKRFSAEAMKWFLNYDWPGNIRELRNLVERAVILSSTDLLSQDYLPASAAQIHQDSSSISIPIGTSLDAAEKTIILQTLSASDNNKSKAAFLLGLSRKALYNKLKRYGIKD
ncbi:MAG: sigma-54 dependent transcriptional regulator [Bacteroidetes bacterium]|nr:sigma-54 dependent transcriptional regulator [Bacteroidota bacterium]